MLQDQILRCADCGKDFIFTIGEQEFYQKRSLTNAPKRCSDCRSKRKAHQHHSGANHKKEFKKFPTHCSRCGVLFDAPFEPKADRPILCRSCFKN